MKKNFILYLFFVCILLTGCNNDTKTVGTLETFNQKFTEAGFTVKDNSNTYNNEKYQGAMIAKLNEDVFVEMVIYNNKENASKVQQEHIEMFQLLKHTGSSIDKYKGSNYYKYIMISNGYYMVSSRIDNTLVFCKVPIENKDIIENTLNEIGY